MDWDPPIFVGNVKVPSCVELPRVRTAASSQTLACLSTYLLQALECLSICLFLCLFI